MIRWSEYSVWGSTVNVQNDTTHYAEMDSVHLGIVCGIILGFTTHWCISAWNKFSCTYVIGKFYRAGGSAGVTILVRPFRRAPTNITAGPLPPSRKHVLHGLSLDDELGGICYRNTQALGFCLCELLPKFSPRRSYFEKLVPLRYLARETPPPATCNP